MQRLEVASVSFHLRAVCILDKLLSLSNKFPQLPMEMIIIATPPPFFLIWEKVKVNEQEC